MSEKIGEGGVREGVDRASLALTEIPSASEAGFLFVCLFDFGVFVCLPSKEAILMPNPGRVADLLGTMIHIETLSYRSVSQ